MNTEDLRRLSERAEGVQGRQAGRLTELHGRIRTARRRRTAAGASAAAGVVIALVAGGAALAGTADRSQEPVDENTPNPTPTQTVETPMKQVTIQPEIGPGDIQSWELRGSRTNTQQGFAGATDLSLTVETGGLAGPQSHVVSFCHGDPDTWWVLTMDLGGLEGGRNPDGSMQDGTRTFVGSCTRDDPTEVPGPTGNIEPGTRNYRERAMAHPLRMFVTDVLSPAAQECLSGIDTDIDACLAAHALTPLADPDATFGFGVYEHTAAPVVLSGPGGIQSQALTMADGVEYLVDRAVLAAAGAARLVVQLPASDRSTIVALVHSETAALEECASKIDIEIVDADTGWAHQMALQRRCVPELELRVDGQGVPPQDDFAFGQQQVVLPPGDARAVTVEVVKNDPRNVRYALVIWEARS